MTFSEACPAHSRYSSFIITIHILINKPSRACDIDSILKIQLSKAQFFDDVGLNTVSELLHQLGICVADFTTTTISTLACLSAIRNVEDAIDFDDKFVAMKDFEVQLLALTLLYHPPKIRP
mmetsp:Transcript_26417/g.39602  ORF Transcript_26417/g.39602 Transcript_26417/m.39602 type:complete len:121 (+) Transcript_26417:255-617(+)